MNQTLTFGSRIKNMKIERITYKSDYGRVDKIGIFLNIENKRFPVQIEEIESILPQIIKIEEIDELKGRLIFREIWKSPTIAPTKNSQ